jgi:hypothetical protein
MRVCLPCWSIVCVLLFPAGCGASGAGREEPDGDVTPADTRANPLETSPDPFDTGSCPATAPIEGAVCNASAVGGAVCHNAPHCQMCAYQRWTIVQNECTCRTGTWKCTGIIVDCFNPAVPGLYDDASCNVPHVQPDAGPDSDAHADATDDADGGDVDARDASDDAAIDAD